MLQHDGRAGQRDDEAEVDALLRRRAHDDGPRPDDRRGAEELDRPAEKELPSQVGEVRERELQTDDEEQQDNADLGEQFDLTDIADQAERVGTGKHARQQQADRRGDAEAVADDGRGHRQREDDDDVGAGRASSSGSAPRGGVPRSASRCGSPSRSCGHEREARRRERRRRSRSRISHARSISSGLDLEPRDVAVARTRNCRKPERAQRRPRPRATRCEAVLGDLARRTGSATRGTPSTACPRWAGRACARPRGCRPCSCRRPAAG